MLLRANISVDEDSMEAMQSMPRNMSASKLLRHMMKAWTYDDKQWLKYKQTEEGQAALEFLKPLRDRLIGK